LADHLIIGKNKEDFQKVFHTKAILASQLLEAFEDEPLKLILFMSSSTARFGRIGQADYAAANEVLNKMAKEEALIHPDAVIKSLNFGPWEGGMVNQVLANKFKSEGIGLIDLKEGAKITCDLLCQNELNSPTELVVLGADTDIQRIITVTNHKSGVNQNANDSLGLKKIELVNCDTKDIVDLVPPDITIDRSSSGDMEKTAPNNAEKASYAVNTDDLSNKCDSSDTYKASEEPKGTIIALEENSKLNLEDNSKLNLRESTEPKVNSLFPKDNTTTTGHPFSESKSTINIVTESKSTDNIDTESIATSSIDSHETSPDLGNTDTTVVGKTEESVPSDISDASVASDASDTSDTFKADKTSGNSSATTPVTIASEENDPQNIDKDERP
jgi:hypothetical protein